MANESRFGRPVAPSSFALRVLRIAEEQSVKVLTLSDCYGGISTHYQGGKKGTGRSIYCKPGECPTTIHNIPPTWKGYFAGLVWDAAVSKWAPWCVELTEWAELDMRGRYQRGQVWMMERKPRPDRQQQPLTCRLVEERDPHDVPPAFDYRPVLLHVYHITKICCDVPNPMPPRVMVEFHELAAPLSDIGQVPLDKPMDLEAFRRLRREHEAKERQQTTNGTH